MESQFEQIAARIRVILRRDLKLGPTAELPDEMPLIGGNMDLDSLDVLLLVTNIEKEFAVKIASQDVGREAFETVGALTRFVANKLAAQQMAAAPATQATAGGDPLSKLPHQDPFRFVSRITSISLGVSGEGVWALTGKEAFFAGHFPGRPLVPGVLIAEALAQLSGVVGATPETGAGKLAQVDVRFDQSVAPPAEIVLQSKIAQTMGNLRQFDVVATHNGAVVARGTLTIAFAGETA